MEVAVVVDVEVGGAPERELVPGLDGDVLADEVDVEPDVPARWWRSPPCLPSTVKLREPK